MFRFRRMNAPWGDKITTLVGLGSAIMASIACADDPVVIVGRPAGASAESTVPASNGDPDSLGIEASAPGTAGITSTQNGSGAGPAANPGAIGAGSAGVNGQAQGVPGCWSLPVVDSARILPVSGRAADLVGGKIVGSSSSPTNGFVDLGEIVAAPAEGDWVVLPLENATAYRYVKYYGPGGSYGAVAELELLAGGVRLEGAGFGSAGSRDESGSVFSNALDGDPATWFEGPLPSDNYVGLDLGAGHENAAPTFTPAPGAASSGDLVTLAAEPGTSVSYTTDGSDPAVNGIQYTGAIALPAGSTLIKAIATSECALPSPVVQGIYSTGGASGQPGPSGVQSSMHIGNSLTDTINDHLPTVAADAGIALDYNRYTIPGAGTWLYDQQPTGGFGVADVQETLRTRAFDHLSLQPFPNWPCQPVPSSDGNDSDSGYLDMAWTDALAQNPNVQLWVYQQWPAPADFTNCMSGGVWTRGDWQPEAPTSWEQAVATELVYHEAVRSALVSLHPEAPPPFIVPGGLALVALKQAIEAGEVPGMTDFFGSLFQAGGEDIHMTDAGAYFITLVFYASMFQQSPEGIVNDSAGALSAEQAAVFQRVAWETVSGYPLSGVDR